MRARSRAYAFQSTLTSVTFWKKDDVQSIVSSRSRRPCARLNSAQKRPSHGECFPST